MDESRHLTAEYAENGEKFAEILGELCVSVVEKIRKFGEKIPL